MKSRRLGRHEQLQAASKGAPSLRRGASGPGVAELQSLLADLGLQFKVSFAKGQPDGIFGAETESAVKDFQRRNGLTSDGIAGPLTIGALDEIVASKPMLEVPTTEAEQLRLAKNLTTPISDNSSAYW
jgi:peptidoglycan hydrolase-like protein with peptidoglycan-binding domain